MNECVCIGVQVHVFLCAQPQVLCNRLQFTPMQVIWNICVVCMWRCAFKMEGILCLRVNIHTHTNACVRYIHAYTNKICCRAYSFFIVQVYKPYCFWNWTNFQAFDIQWGGGEREGSECVYTCACVDEGGIEICNTLLNYVVYCCNVSWQALWASHMYSHRGI